MNEFIPSPDNRLTSWMFAVVDKFKPLSGEEIRSELRRTASPFAILASCIQGDFNLSSLTRSANGFNAEKVFYTGKKKWDRRGAVGAHNYTPPEFLPNFSDVLALKQEYHFVAFENVGKTTRLDKFNWDFYPTKKPLILLGEEGNGLSDEMLALADDLIEIPMMGSVRSFNLAVAGSIAMYDFLSKKILL